MVRRRAWQAGLLVALRADRDPRVAAAAAARHIPISTEVWSADGELLRVTLASDDQYRLWVPLDAMSPALVDAFLLKEDRWFHWHPGVNPVALARAAVRTYGGSGRQGGSTITMQLARLRGGLRTRTPLGKLRQIAGALGSSCATRSARCSRPTSTSCRWAATSRASAPRAASTSASRRTA